MKYPTLTFILFLLLISFAPAEESPLFSGLDNKKIVTCPIYSKNIKELALEHDLILLDLDDVVLTTKQYVCGSIWFNNRWGKYAHELTKQYGKKIAEQRLVEDFHACPTEHEPVSKDLILDFLELSLKKKVLGLTARELVYLPKTLKALSSVGMEFSPTTALNDPVIRNGIIFSGYNLSTSQPNKGLLVKKLITDNLLGEVKSVFFIDDSLKNLQNVKTHLDPNIKFTGIHLTTVQTKLLSEIEEALLDLVEEYQFATWEQYGYLPSNREALDALYHSYNDSIFNNSCPLLRNY